MGAALGLACCLQPSRAEAMDGEQRHSCEGGARWQRTLIGWREKPHRTRAAFALSGLASCWASPLLHPGVRPGVWPSWRHPSASARAGRQQRASEGVYSLASLAIPCLSINHTRPFSRMRSSSFLAWLESATTKIGSDCRSRNGLCLEKPEGVCYGTQKYCTPTPPHTTIAR